ncbi:serine hydrolase domain-containing protein [Deinococcus pimensis]|uniref:serine hydrolase domain-containing protein n=1 Tax=Deinococcus pimensis TaxID=309888 RepID=UPI00048A1C89|nr:serine hydrolase domain-containing protein [Deinococcus pimensis]
MTQRVLRLISARSLGLLSTALFSAQASTLDASTLRRIDTFVQQRMQAGGVPGVAIAIVKDGRVLTRAYGVADLASRRPMSRYTPVGIGSTTKTLTALAVMQLVSAGRVELDAPVRDYLPEFTPSDLRARRITVRQLLSHTSGLPSSTALDRDISPQAPMRRLQALLANPLTSDPGSRFEYANDGYVILGVLISRVSGQTYEEYLRRHVFEPLRMNRATFDGREAERLGLSRSYLKYDQTYEAMRLPFTRSLNPAGLLMMSANDAGLYLRALLATHQGRTSVLRPALLNEMWSKQATMNSTRDYGLGWMLNTTNGAGVVYHSGNILVSGSMFLLDPANGLGVAVLSNIVSRTKDEVAQGLLDLLRGRTPEPSRMPPARPSTDFKQDPARWTSILGEYDSPNEGHLRLTVREGTLVGEIADPYLPMEFRLREVAEGKFVAYSSYIPFDNTDFTFEVAPDGRTNLLVNGQVHAVRVLP